jgi:[acyl-carrier-protein] S-malonyltransferase
MELAKAAGARRAILLPVSAPFHCELMRPAQEKMRAELDAVQMHDLCIPLMNNWQAREVRTASEVRDGLYQQIPNPVRWTESVTRMAAMGVDRVIEVGPGNVLCGLIRQIEPGLKTVGFGDSAELEKVRVLAAAT